MTMPKVVTIGGGHGQAALLAALRRLDCDVTAIVSVADDGGCSGRLTQQFGMPPPGDLRRCLTTIACDMELARRFEQRLQLDDTDEMRCAGNLALLEAYISMGSLQSAVDWAAAVLRCWGRVVPVAEMPGQLAVYDQREGILHGETTVASRGDLVMAVAVHGIDYSNKAAHTAIAEADIILLGPGSFVTSTLAAITTGQIASALVQSTAKKVFVSNIAQEPGQLTEFELADYVRMLRDHLSIHSHTLFDADGQPTGTVTAPSSIPPPALPIGANQGSPAKPTTSRRRPRGEVTPWGTTRPTSMPMTVLCHDLEHDRPWGVLGRGPHIGAGSEVVMAGLMEPGLADGYHDPGRLSGALATLLDLKARPVEPSPSSPGSGASPLAEVLTKLNSPTGRQAEFEAFLQSGMVLASKRPASGPRVKDGVAASIAKTSNAAS